jgi:hypothetical protein
MTFPDAVLAKHFGQPAVLKADFDEGRIKKLKEQTEASIHARD